VKIKEEWETLVTLTPLTLQKMIFLPKPTNLFRIFEVDAFLDAYGDGDNILKE
jgi:hypothetical protein